MYRETGMHPPALHLSPETWLTLKNQSTNHLFLVFSRGVQWQLVGGEGRRFEYGAMHRADGRRGRQMGPEAAWRHRGHRRRTPAVTHRHHRCPLMTNDSNEAGARENMQIKLEVLFNYLILTHTHIDIYIYTNSIDESGGYIDGSVGVNMGKTEKYYTCMKFRFSSFVFLNTLLFSFIN